MLRKKGINRIGNLLVPNENYCLFENWIMPILDQMLKEQKEQVGRDVRCRGCCWPAPPDHLTPVSLTNAGRGVDAVEDDPPPGQGD